MEETSDGKQEFQEEKISNGENGVEETGNEDEATETDTNEPEATFVDGQLSYLGLDAKEIPRKLIDDYSAVTRRLDLSFNRLHSLEGLEQFINLEELVLDNNCLGDDIKIPKLNKLHTLTLNKNKICNLNNLLDNLVDCLPALRYLSMLGNVACPNQLSCADKDEEDYRRYRCFVLYRLNQLKFLDSTPVKKEELVEAKRVGPFMQVVKVSSDDIKDTKEGTDTESNAYSPLPDSSRNVDEPIGSFGKSKYVYHGHHSEGNRFIRNNDL